jgi:hypothetical protein
LLARARIWVAGSGGGRRKFKVWQVSTSHAAAKK